ncbi:hypothetical protein FQN54_001228 [Arachnomyces sp. PD_36]|nr:hypothetical protein FQN54_001228 [Arachnomyces sp. PD_36]
MSVSSTSSNKQLTRAQLEALGSPGPAVMRPTYEQLWRDYHQLDITFQATRQQLERTQIELGEAMNRAAHDQTQIARLQSTVERQEELIQKQKTTISTQSKTISDPKHLKQQNGASTTPQKRSSHGNLLETPHTNHRRGIFDRTSPVRDASVQQPPGLFRTSSQQHLMPYRLDLAPVSPTKTSFAPPNGGMMMSEEYIALFPIEFRDLWLKAETFGHLHANAPDIQKDSRIDQKIKQVLMAVSDSSTASFLLNNATTRYFLVGKVINHILTREVLKISVVKGFNAATDSEIGQIKRQIFPDTPPTVRCILYAAVAHQFAEMRRKPGFDEFLQRRIHENAIKCWNLVAPLMHEVTDNAWEDLLALVTEAHTLALKMYSGPHEFKFEYANTNDLFDPKFSVNRDQQITSDTQALVRGQFRVKLGITPTITFRNYASGTGEPRIIHYGGVLLRPPYKNSHA